MSMKNFDYTIWNQTGTGL